MSKAGMEAFGDEVWHLAERLTRGGSELDTAWTAMALVTQFETGGAVMAAIIALGTWAADRHTAHEIRRTARALLAHWAE